jgi:hypothetical protein
MKRDFYIFPMKKIDFCMAYDLTFVCNFVKENSCFLKPFQTVI